ncbi:hypothetical protein SAMN05660841_00366 [Sphingobacterium nematocida]|uniref:Uncharacterized protein n=1 Tax=Sphingobacterium nematocida TaxID=1513896 RepID=A0A1T5B0X7_9SPHI|nr:hypothetical protein SAMN05660841_00366 [Sphingobacterium nematocida]
MDRRRILIFLVLILMLLLVEFVIPFQDLVIPAWNTLIIPANVVKSIIALILLMLIGIYLYVQIKKIPKR